MHSLLCCLFLELVLSGVFFKSNPGCSTWFDIPDAAESGFVAALTSPTLSLPGVYCLASTQADAVCGCTFEDVGVKGALF